MTIRLLTSNGEQLVIPPGEAHKLLKVEDVFTYGACYIPFHPILEKGYRYTCD